MAMAFKLALAAEGHWRKVYAPYLVVLLRAGARFRDGIHVVTSDVSDEQAVGSRERIAA